MLLCQQLPFLLDLVSILPRMALYFLQGLNSCKFDKLTTLQEKLMIKKNPGKTLTVLSYPVFTSIAISSESVPRAFQHDRYMVYTMSFNKTFSFTRTRVRLPKVYALLYCDSRPCYQDSCELRLAMLSFKLIMLCHKPMLSRLQMLRAGNSKRGVVLGWREQFLK